MSIIALEGSSFSGKTTLSNQLSERLDAPVIGEYIDYALRARLDGFPPFACNRTELDEQVEFYLELEASRAQDVASSGSSIVIVDRTVASLAAFHRIHQRRAERLDTYWDTDLMERRIRLSQELGRIVVPDVIFVLSAGSKEEHDARVKCRGAIAEGHLSLLNDWNFSEELRQDTCDALHSIFPTQPVIECVTSTGSQTVEGIITNIQEVTGV